MHPSAGSSGGWKGLLRRPLVLLALSLLGLAMVMSVLGRLTQPADPVVKALSTEAGTESYPALSRDGKQVAYSGRASGGSQSFDIFVRAVAGGAPRRLTSGEATDLAPAWSPDGTRLAFGRVEQGKVRYVVMPVSGGDPTVAAEFDGLPESLPPGVAWTRDGQRLAVVGRAGEQAPSILLAPASGGQATALT